MPLIWSDGHGVTVTKTFTFRRGATASICDYNVDNRSTAPWQAAIYAQILRYDPPSARSMFFNVEGNAFHGPAIYDGAKYRKLKIDNAEDRHLAVEVRNGWLAALQHHFVSAVVPATRQRKPHHAQRPGTRVSALHHRTAAQRRRRHARRLSRRRCT